ncbi:MULTISPECIES: exodeoxyribonuclease VII small subunit [Geobacillus]|jgi:exodeoxyribonuclease VII small subunit|uniref:Exodeoxyribonuclease 7 small subunit n=2 Tax=Geobacillus thermodenitrificans TaxID=33940 RepID=EX7S_GEOTN|nr:MULTISPECIES: exodeoxyribonuclease VII small subunit [Geobacillus]A4IQR9.1 RecName: Full=Exodeoxyribonuclease 7 small subunit; AltName: Full=Exodeoxyribonuclease VII small subunit; Short=Exonuclease VII small subunit [Geobacillus thermodenitrificans NG80-2]ABO67673.1 Exodeoxyribonuclease VII small subunit [Geobacillus thermodenitrificans NG80-2]ARA99190.1 exodeoxyribonuclease VII small subunit [Geobacillus thermodenitrificans]ARP43412.1 Exodeoxyribonuclease 7 small subunit [Geobacillus therm
MSEEKEMTFEEAMKQLESIVEKLEEGNVPLEDAIAFFQEGMKLSKLCHDKLQHVEKQLEYMLREDGELVPFSPEEA